MNALPIQLMKHHDRSQIKRSARSMLWGSVLAMILSCALFAGATHAWFSDRCSAQITLQSATFDVEVVVTTPEGGTPEISTENGVYVCNLNSGTYEVTLTRRGSASVGYCEISVGNDVYYSQNLSAQTESLSFTLVITRDNVPVTFTPKWSNAEQADPDLIPISETGITYADPNAETNQAAQQKVQQAAQQEAPSESDEPKQPESGEGKENTSGEEDGSIGSGSSGPETGENAGDAKDSSEVKQPEVIPETSPAELSKDSSENQ